MAQIVKLLREEVSLLRAMMEGQAVTIKQLTETNAQQAQMFNMFMSQRTHNTASGGVTIDMIQQPTSTATVSGLVMSSPAKTATTMPAPLPRTTTPKSRASSLVRPAGQSSILGFARLDTTSTRTTTTTPVSSTPQTPTTPTTPITPSVLDTMSSNNRFSLLAPLADTESTPTTSTATPVATQQKTKQHAGNSGRHKRSHSDSPVDLTTITPSTTSPPSSSRSLYDSSRNDGGKTKQTTATTTTTTDIISQLTKTKAASGGKTASTKRAKKT